MKSKGFAILAVTLLVGPMAVHSEEVTFVSSAQVTYITPGGEFLGGTLSMPVTVGDELRFTYTFESTTAPQTPSPYGTQHLIYRALKYARVEVAGNVWAFVPSNICNNQINVEDDYLGTDGYFWDVYAVSPSDCGPEVPGGFALVLLSMQSMGTTTPVAPLSSAALPVVPPNPATFQSAFIRLITRGYQIDTGRIVVLRNVAEDTDEDGIVDSNDNCPLIANADQTDADADGLGDVCDDDDDNDGVLDGSDNCRLASNVDQRNVDGDSFGDACDGDMDGDGLANASDNCPVAANPDQTDTDDDGFGDECDNNDDNDAHPDVSDNCASVPNNDQQDLDQDGHGDVCDEDLDGDGFVNESDNCPIDANASQDDTDGDLAGDACDADDDADTIPDDGDNCRLIPNVDQKDADGDDAGDVCDGDLDGDNIANGSDNCPTVANTGQADFDADGIGDACDNDVDGDQVANTTDVCGLTPRGGTVDSDGCTIGQLCPCDGPGGTVLPWRNHGKYVSCVAQSTNRFQAAGLISSAEHDEVVSIAAQSACGGSR